MVSEPPAIRSVGTAHACGIRAGLVECLQRFGIQLQIGGTEQLVELIEICRAGNWSGNARLLGLASSRELSPLGRARPEFGNRARSDISSPSSLSRSWPNPLRNGTCPQEIRWLTKSKESRRSFRAGKEAPTPLQTPPARKGCSAAADSRTAAGPFSYRSAALLPVSWRRSLMRQSRAPFPAGLAARTLRAFPPAAYRRHQHATDINRCSRSASVAANLPPRPECRLWKVLSFLGPIPIQLSLR